MERALPRRGQKCYTEPKPSRRQRAPGDQEELMLTFNHFNFNAAMGCICFDNPAMGIYFVTDPDGYWIEIIPTR